jgi:hypothetical protein
MANKQDRKKEFLAAVQAALLIPPLNKKQPGADHIIEHLLEHCYHQHSVLSHMKNRVCPT